MKRRRQLAIGPRGELIIRRGRRHSDLILNWIACCVVGCVVGLVVGILILAIWATPAGAATCSHEPGDDGAWTWRMIDGQRCWYEGRRVIAKDQLHWSHSAPPGEAGHSGATENTGSASTDAAVRPTNSWLERVSDNAPPAEIYFLSTVNGRSALDGYPALIWRQPWLNPETIMNWPLLIDIDQVPFTAWTKRIAQ